MTFEDVTGDGSLWAVVYDGEVENALEQAFNRWNDQDGLMEFFTANFRDLADYFKRIPT